MPLVHRNAFPSGRSLRAAALAAGRVASLPPPFPDRHRRPPKPATSPISTRCVFAVAGEVSIEQGAREIADHRSRARGAAQDHDRDPRSAPAHRPGAGTVETQQPIRMKLGVQQPARLRVAHQPARSASERCAATRSRWCWRAAARSASIAWTTRAASTCGSPGGRCRGRRRQGGGAATRHHRHRAAIPHPGSPASAPKSPSTATAKCNSPPAPRWLCASAASATCATTATRP